MQIVIQSSIKLDNGWRNKWLKSLKSYWDVVWESTFWYVKGLNEAQLVAVWSPHSSWRDLLKMEVRSYFYFVQNAPMTLSHTTHKTELKIDQRPKCKSEKYKTLRRKHWGKASCHWIWQWYCEYDTQLTGNKWKNRSIGVHQNLSFCASKDTIKTVKRQLKKWEKIFASHISHRVLISRMYKELLQLNKKNPGNSIKKQATGLQ